MLLLFCDVHVSWFLFFSCGCCWYLLCLILLCVAFVRYLFLCFVGLLCVCVCVFGFVYSLRVLL